MVRVRLVDVICDTSFIIHLAAGRIKNLASLDTEIGQINFVVPGAVTSELRRLLQSPGKRDAARAALGYSEKLGTLDEIRGTFADGAILEYVRDRGGGMVATLDRELKSGVKAAGGSVLSLASDRIVLEP